MEGRQWVKKVRCLMARNERRGGESTVPPLRMKEWGETRRCKKDEAEGRI